MKKIPINYVHDLGIERRKKSKVTEEIGQGLLS